MANTKITSRVIADDAVTTAAIADDVALGGNPTTTTQSAGNSTTRIATTAFVTTAVSNLVDSAPGALDTLNELAAALGDDASFSTTVTNSIATKLAASGADQTLADSGNLTLDVAGDITLDADGGDINFKDGGTLFGQISNSSGLYLVSNVSDADIFIRGNDGGSYVNALTFDMSEAGAATFNAGATFGGSGTGAGLYLNGTNSDSIAQGNFVRYGTNFLTQSNAANSNLITYAFNGSTFVNALNISPSGGVTVNSSQNSNINFIAKSGSDANALVLDGSSGALGLGAAPVYGRLDVRQTGTGAQDRGLYVEVSPSSSGSNLNAALINAGNANLTGTVVRIHHESPAANQKLLSLDTTGANEEVMYVDEDGDGYFKGVLLVGATTDAGSASNTTRIRAGVFATYQGSTAATHNVPTTMFSLPGGLGTYILSAGFDGIGNTSAYSSCAIVHGDGTSYKMTTITTSTAMSWDISGSNVRVQQSSGSTLNVSWSMIRIQ